MDLAKRLNLQIGGRLGYALQCYGKPLEENRIKGILRILSYSPSYNITNLPTDIINIFSPGEEDRMEKESKLAIEAAENLGFIKKLEL